MDRRSSISDDDDDQEREDRPPSRHIRFILSYLRIIARGHL